MVEMVRRTKQDAELLTRDHYSVCVTKLTWLNRTAHYFSSCLFVCFVLSPTKSILRSTSSRLIKYVQAKSNFNAMLCMRLEFKCLTKVNRYNSKLF